MILSCFLFSRTPHHFEAEDLFSDVILGESRDCHFIFTVKGQKRIREEEYWRAGLHGRESILGGSPGEEDWRNSYCIKGRLRGDMDPPLRKEVGD